VKSEARVGRRYSNADNRQNKGKSRGRKVIPGWKTIGGRDVGQWAGRITAKAARASKATSRNGFFVLDEGQLRQRRRFFDSYTGSPKGDSGVLPSASKITQSPIRSSRVLPMPEVGDDFRIFAVRRVVQKRVARMARKPLPLSRRTGSRPGGPAAM